jgi:sulfopyruvate decarboxylase TPP-binding subunit
VLAPLLGLLEKRQDYEVVAREDNVIGMSVGVALGGGSPVALMQNSGLGQAVNALASLVVPYQVPLLLVVSLRGTPPDLSEENQAMGRLTGVILDELGIKTDVLDVGNAERHIRRAHQVVHLDRRPFALLVRPDAFAWRM